MKDLPNKEKLAEIYGSVYPIFELNISIISLTIWNKKIGGGVTLCETSPYAPDGEVPLTFIDIGRFQIMIDNFYLYKTIYKKRYGYTLEKPDAK